MARLKTFRGNESGAIAMVFALMLPIMIGFVGLAVDVSMWYLEKRALQEAVDSGAVAGSLEKSNGRSDTDVKEFVRQAVARSGYDLTVDTDLFVNSPPSQGRFAVGGSLYNADDAKVVEVIATVTHQTYFSAIFDLDSVEIAARAVAGQNGTGTAACLMSYDEGIDIGGSAILNGPDCGIHTQTKDGGGKGNDIVRAGASGSHSFDCATSTDGTISTSFTDHPNATFADGCTPSSGSKSIDNPFSSIETPSDLSCSASKYQPANAPVEDKSAKTITFSPGIYCGSKNGSYDIGKLSGSSFSVTSATASKVIFEPGVYYIEGGLSITSQVELDAAGVMFVIVNTDDSINGTGGVLDVAGGTTTGISGPKLDDLIDSNGDIVINNPYSDMLGITDADTLAEWADLTVVNLTEGPKSGGCNEFTGSSNADFYGIVYAPFTCVKFAGDASAGSVPSDQCRAIISKGLEVSGSVELALKTCNDSGQSKLQTRVVGLVE